MNTSAFYDVLVIGGGASSLAAAITAARAGKSVCIVERDVACGLKLLATGNGRCNLSNESIDPQRYNHPAFVESVMGPQPEQELIGFFSSLGIMTTSEEGRLYPRSLRAESVRDALLNVCDRLGITLICGANVASAHKASEGWALQIDRPARALKAKKARRPKIGAPLASESARRCPSQERGPGGTCRNYRHGWQPHRYRRYVSPPPHFAAPHPLPRIGNGRRRSGGTQDVGWPARPRPLDARPQS